MDLPVDRSPDPFARLPSELCAMLLSLLPDEDLIAVSHVSSFLRSQCLDDSLYAPFVKPRLESLLGNAAFFPGDMSRCTPTEIRELICKLPCTSGTSYFDNIDSIRDFFLRQHFLKKSWDSGRAPRVAKLRSPDGHRLPIDRLVVDSTFNQIISIDYSGLVCFWDVETGAVTKTLDLGLGGNTVWDNHGGLMALKDDLLLAGVFVWPVYLPEQKYLVLTLIQAKLQASWSIHICTRDPPSVPVGTRGFTPVSLFTVADPVRSILIEGFMCILGYWGGAVEFWDLQKASTPRKCLRINPPQHFLMIDENYTIFYRRPCLLLSSVDIVRISPRNKDDNNLPDIWNYPAEDIVWEIFTHVVFRDDFFYMMSLKNVKISPVGRNGGVLLALPNSNVIRIDSFWDTVGHTVEGALVTSGPKGCQLRSLAATDGYFSISYTQGEQAWHKQPGAETTVCLYHENGDQIAEYVGYSPVSATIMDPCILVSAEHGRRRPLTIMDFRPRARPNNGPKEVSIPSSVGRQCALRGEGGNWDIGLTLRPTKRNRKKRANASSSRRTKKAPNYSLAEIVNAPEDTSIRSTESTSVSMQVPSNNANTTIGQPQGVVTSWGDAAIQALNSHSGGRGGLLASEILGLVLWSGLRKIMVGQEEDVLREVEEALNSASQAGEVPIERVAACRSAKPRYRSSRPRRGVRGDDRGSGRVFEEE
ncbi:hypothetical protein GP486_005241 [Trichoglossum hirsutum]|uniref:F-box domain-containing protein n=1 Tax=Trichoglossum hirsutum TaxID=265104 RepID=A0A9P8L9I6_9PEZI|nr:hypothetical protein GP486_005241 [Trichoglossum hirsutum]